MASAATHVRGIIGGCPPYRAMAEMREIHGVASLQPTRLMDIPNVRVGIAEAMPKDHLPIVFIGSSNEGLEIAKALLSNLSGCSEPQIWTQGVFGLGQGTLEALASAATSADFAILVMTPDDFVESRGKSNHMPRDNIVFELGLFIGTLGRDRTFMVFEEDSDLKLPSDVAGITAATFRRSSQLSINASVAPAAVKIEECVKRLEFRPEHRQALLIGLWKYEVSGASGNHDWGGICELEISGNEIKIKGHRDWETQNGEKRPLHGHYWETKWATLSQGNKLRFEHSINLRTGPARGFCALTVGNSLDRMEGEFYYFAPHAENGTVAFSRKCSRAGATACASSRTHHARRAYHRSVRPTSLMTPPRRY
jgi:predicted nucleotide-binding protein